MLGGSYITGGLRSLFFVLGRAALTRAFARTRCVTVLEFNGFKTEDPRPIKPAGFGPSRPWMPTERSRMSFCRQFGPEYRSDLLI